jgi:hypothetical protein
MKILKAGLLYFILVFGAGFILGPIRLFWVVPRIGTRTAELMEAPIMLIIIYLAARWVISYFKIPSRAFHRISIGGIALLLLLTSEFTLVLQLMGLSISEYFASRDTISGTVYCLCLIVFAITPMFINKQ